MKMNPRYFHVFLGIRIGPPMEERLREGRVKRPCDLLKWKTSVFKCSTIRPNLSKLVQKLGHYIVAIKETRARRDKKFVLRNEKSIIYKQNDRNWNVIIF